MPGLGEVLALPAPPPGGIVGPLPTAQLPEEPEVEVDNGEKVKPASVATQTRTIGMIHPPPDVRSIVDKTAQFVARNGPEFEKRILANEKGNVKFNFLKSEDPYHAYYQHRVTEFRTQLQTPAQTPGVGSAAAAAAAPKGPEGGAAGAAKEVDVTKADNIETKPVTKVLDPPEPEQYTVRLPEGLTSLDLDIIKLTAQLVARNGKNFLNGLTSREHSSPQFYFLKPTHSMFSFFTALADAYSKVLMPPKGLPDRMKRDASSKTVVLERCLQRLEWERSQERARQKAEDEIEQERMQMALIDWHDFVVVETIEFAEEEDDELPQPMTLEDVIRRSKALATEEDEEEIAQAGREVEMEMDEEEMELVEASMKATNLQDSAKGDDSTEQPMDEADPPMRIVKNWRRPEDRIPAEKDPTKFVVSPITGELIQINEMAEHMRISLIDPKYKEQKERMMAKLRETTLATDDEISRNIVGLARTRPDIFGTTEEEVSNAVKAEIEKKKEEPKQVIWDGHTGSISRTANQAMAQTMTLEEQIAATHREKANLTADGRPLPGPAAPPGPKLAPPPQRPLPPPPGLAPNIPRTQHLPPSTSATTTAPPAPPIVQRPAILPTPPPPMRPPPPAAPPALQNPLLVRPSAATLPPPMVPPPAGVPQYPPPPRPFPPVMAPAMPMAPPPPPPPSALPPPPPPEEVPPPPPEEPEPKRQKMDEVQLIPEDQFLAQHPGPVRITISVPAVEGEGNLKGQILEITIQSLSETILNVKEKIANELAMPANKQKLNSQFLFLKDNLSLAHYNIVPGETLTLGLKERGGRKK